MQKHNSLQQYQRIAEGQRVAFTQSDDIIGPRLVKMRVNSPDPVKLYVTRLDHDDPQTGEVFVEKNDKGEFVHTDIRFLGNVHGLDHIEFYYTGNFGLHALGGEIWLETIDGMKFEVEATDFTSYARVWEREQEDPRILEIKRDAQRREHALYAQMAQDRADRLALIEEVRKIRESQNVASTPPAPAPAGESATGEQSAVGGETAAPAAAPAGT